MKQHTKTISIVAITFCLFAATIGLAQFVGPTQAAPGGNVNAPINVGATPQIKQSALGVTGMEVAATPNGIPAGYLLDVEGPGSFGSLITANARVSQIATVQQATIPVCVNATGDLGLCAALAVTITASPASVQTGSTTTLTWSAPTATACTATAGPGFSTNNAISGSDASTALTSTTTFTVSCTNAQGATQTASVTVPVTQAPQGPAGQLVVDIQASQATITNGQSVTLTWPNNNAVLNCDASWIAGPNNGTGPTSVVSPTQTTTYTITCTDDNNDTGTDSVTVTVTQNQPQVVAPTVDALVRNQTQNTGAASAWVLGGTPAIVTWTTTGTSPACVITGGAYGQAGQAIAAQGTLSITTAAADYVVRTYTITCTNQAGTASDTVTANVWSLNQQITWNYLNPNTACDKVVTNASVRGPLTGGASMTANYLGVPAAWDTSTTSVVNGIQSVTKTESLNDALAVGDPDITYTATELVSGQTATATRVITAPVQGNGPGLCAL